MHLLRVYAGNTGFKRPLDKRSVIWALSLEANPKPVDLKNKRQQF